MFAPHGVFPALVLNVRYQTESAIPLAAFLLDGPRFTLSGPQRPLGEKVDDALTSCFAAGYERVAVVAGDVAGLTREFLADAFSKTI